MVDLAGPSTHDNGSIQYTATLTNEGSHSASEVVQTVDVPSQVRLDEVSAPGATCTFAGGVLACEVGPLAAGETVEMTVEGTVTVDESYSVTASARANETDTWPGDDEASLSTFAGSPAPDPEVAAEPLAVDFGDVRAGDAETRAVTVANGGTGTLEVTDLSVTGADAANFSAADGGPFVLAPGASRDVAVDYAPTAAGPHAATLEIASNDTDAGTLTVALEGNGTEATGAAAYANESGVVDNEGLRTAVDDWRAGDISTALLRDVVDYWRTGDPVS
nr:choice-of-anchor D domain-containing protein [Natronomonas marina]